MDPNVPNNKPTDNSQPVGPQMPAAPAVSTPAPEPTPTKNQDSNQNIPGQPDQIKKSSYKILFAVILVCIIIVTAGLAYITVYKPSAPEVPIADKTPDLTIKQQITPTMIPPTEIPTPTLSPEEEIDSNFQQIDDKINTLDNSLTEVENGLNDKQTNLSE